MGLRNVAKIEEDLAQFLKSVKGPEHVRKQIARILKRGDFFDAGDLKAPALQYRVWRLRQEGYPHGSIGGALACVVRFSKWLKDTGRITKAPLAGVNASAWARGELEHIERRPPHAWWWLRQYEEYEGGAQTYHNLDAIIDCWNAYSDKKRQEIDPNRWQTLPAKTMEERDRSRQIVYHAIRYAQIVRDGEPGTPLRPRPRPVAATLRAGKQDRWRCSANCFSIGL